LRNKNYSQLMYFDRKLFAIGEYLAKLIKNELWTSRFELISKSWIYDCPGDLSLMGLKERFTIPASKASSKPIGRNDGHSYHTRLGKVL
jgi:hypothetical protein